MIAVLILLLRNNLLVVKLASLADSLQLNCFKCFNTGRSELQHSVGCLGRSWNGSCRASCSPGLDPTRLWINPTRSWSLGPAEHFEGSKPSEQQCYGQLIQLARLLERYTHIHPDQNDPIVSSCTKACSLDTKSSLFINLVNKTQKEKQSLLGQSLTGFA